MSIPESAHDPSGHAEHLKLIQIRLREEYAELRETGPPQKIMPALEGNLSRVQRRSRLRIPPPRRRQAQFARLFILMLLLHVVVVGGVVIAEMTGSSLIWRAIAGAVIIWLLIRGMAALSRRITPPRRKTSRAAGRNCDRDIWL